MIGNYTVYLGSQPAGKVQVLRQGLYYRFICRCQLTGDVVCRLYISSGGKRENLGVVVPAGSGFGLDTRIPVKRFREGNPEFFLIPGHDPTTERFVPIMDTEPFSYIEQLKTSYLVKKYGKIGIMIEENENQTEISNPTGQ